MIFIMAKLILNFPLDFDITLISMGYLQLNEYS